MLSASCQGLPCWRHLSMRALMSAPLRGCCPARTACSAVLRGSSAPAQGLPEQTTPSAHCGPLSEGTFASQLLQQLPEEDLPLLCLMYWRLLTALPDLAPACGLSAQKEEASFVNALVRRCHLPLKCA